MIPRSTRGLQWVETENTESEGGVVWLVCNPTFPPLNIPNLRLRVPIGGLQNHTPVLVLGPRNGKCKTEFAAAVSPSAYVSGLVKVRLGYLHVWVPLPAEFHQCAYAIATTYTHTNKRFLKAPSLSLSLSLSSEFLYSLPFPSPLHLLRFQTSLISPLPPPRPSTTTASLLFPSTTPTLPSQQTRGRQEGKKEEEQT
jgi:hypothetical protein